MRSISRLNSESIGSNRARSGPEERTWRTSVLVTLSGALSLGACVFTPPPPLPEELEAERQAKAEAAAAQKPDAQGEELAAGGEAAKEGGQGSDPAMDSVAAVLLANKEAGDPVEGLFTLEAALAGLEGEGKLYAEIVTPRGAIACELFEDLTPVTVANFAGLARGTRPFLDANTQQWVTRPYYEGTTFHRIIPGFMIQGGDPTGTRMGNPGYVIPDEIQPTLIHAEAGVLSMANRGPNTGGGQFFVTLGPTPNLDGKHTVFGQCDSASIRIADDISIAPRDASDKPLEDELVTTVRIVRR
jgi:peptidyl-prolyl cis-trans isomerase A (cyclophilin A)